MDIPTDSPVMLSGATGYVAGVLCKQLLEAGLTVHCPVRDPDNAEKIQHLVDVAAGTSGSLKFFKADLNVEDSYSEAMEGCSVVFHTASPFVMAPKDVEKDLLKPAVEGTANVLKSCEKTESVKRVVLTSSCFAIATDAKDTLKKAVDESVWNSTASKKHNPYALSKKLAEEKAWEMAKAQSQYKLVVINPAWIFGPGLKAHKGNESFGFLKLFGDGVMKSGVPKIGCWVVDVRDVATAHVKAGFLESAEGRNIISAHNTNFKEISDTIKAKYPSYPLPKSAAPWPIVWLMAPLMGMTRRYVYNNINMTAKVDNTKSVEKLGMTYKTMEETYQEMFQQMIDADWFKKD